MILSPLLRENTTAKVGERPTKATQMSSSAPSTVFEEIGKEILSSIGNKRWHELSEDVPYFCFQARKRCSLDQKTTELQVTPESTKKIYCKVKNASDQTPEKSQKKKKRQRSKKLCLTKNVENLSPFDGTNSTEDRRLVVPRSPEPNPNVRRPNFRKAFTPNEEKQLNKMLEDLRIAHMRDLKFAKNFEFQGGFFSVPLSVDKDATSLVKQALASIDNIAGTFTPLNVAELTKAFDTEKVGYDLGSGLGQGIWDFIKKLSASPLAQLCAFGMIFKLSVQVYKGDRDPKTLLLILVAGTVLSVKDGALQTLMSYLTKKTFRFQDGLLDPTLIKMLFSLLGFATLSRWWKWDSTFGTKIISACCNFGWEKKGLDQCIDFILKVIQKIYDFIRVQMGLRPSSLFDPEEQEMQDWLVKTAEFLDNMSKPTRKLTPSVGRYLMLLLKEGKAIFVKGVKSHPEWRAQIGPYMKDLETLADTCRVMGVYSPQDRSPIVCACYRGPTEIGKSLAINAAANAFMLATCEPEERAEIASDPGKFRYTKTYEGDVFWEGYHDGVKVTIMDEFDAVTGTDMLAKVALTIIRAVNVVPYPLPMGTLGLKGNVHFNSNLLILTSNSAETNMEYVRHPEAFSRRIHLDYEVGVHPDFAKPRSGPTHGGGPLWNRALDLSKLKNPEKFCPEAYVFKNKRTGKILTFDEHVEEMVLQYKKEQEAARRTQASGAYGTKLGEKLAAQFDFQSGNTVDFFGDPNEEPVKPRRVVDPDDKERIKRLKSYVKVLVAVMLDPALSLTAERELNDVLGRVREEVTTMHFDEEIVKQGNAFISDLNIRRDYFVMDWDVLMAYFCFFLKFNPFEVDTTFTNAPRTPNKNSIMLGFLRMYLHKFPGVVKKGPLDRLICRFHDMVNLPPETAPCLWDTEPFDPEWCADSISFLLRILNTGIQCYLSYKLFSKLYQWLFSGTDSEKESLERQGRLKSIAPIKGFKGEKADAAAIGAILASNCVQVSCGKLIIGFGLFLSDRNLCIPRHFVATMREVGEEIVLKHMSSRKDQEVSLDVFENVEIAEVPLPESILVAIPGNAKYRDIRSWIAKPEEVAKLREAKNFKVGLMVPKEKKMDSVECHSGEGFSSESVSDILMQQNVSDKLTYGYKINTVIGWCGAPLFSLDKLGTQPRLLGMHIGATTGTGIGYATGYPEGFEKQGAVLDETVSQLVSEGKDNPIVKTGPRFFRPGQTVIRRSPLAGTYSIPKKAPAVLKCSKLEDGTLCDPMDRALAGMLRPMWEAPGRTDHVDLIADYWVRRLSAVIYRPTHSILTFDDAVSGMPEPFYDGIVRSTSAGMFGRRNGITDKRSVFGSEGPYTMTTPLAQKCRDAVNELRRNVKNGINASYSGTDFPCPEYLPIAKDELLSLAKVEAKRTRVIFVGDLPWLIYSKMCFNSINEWLMKARIHNGMGLGINPFARDWEILARKLDKKLIFAGDIAENDFRHNSEAYDEVFRRILRHAFVQDEEYEEVWACFQRNARWVYLHEGKYYSVRGKIPSGEYGTSFKNSLLTQFLLLQAFLDIDVLNMSLLQKTEYWSTETYMVSSGDDFLLAVTPEFATVVKLSDIIANAHKRWFKITDSNKGDNYEWEKIETVTFLKRKFRFEPVLNRRVAPLDLDTILEIPMWTKKGVLSDKIWRDNVDISLLELSLHSEETWDLWAPKIIESSISHGYVPRSSNRKALIQFSGSYVPKWMKTRYMCGEKPLHALVSVEDSESLQLPGGDIPERQNQCTSAVPCATEGNVEQRLVVFQGRKPIKSLKPGIEGALEASGTFEQIAPASKENGETTPANNQSENIDTEGRLTVNGSTTVMNNELQTQEASRELTGLWPRSLIKNADSGYNQEYIKQFLAKPLVLASGDWNSSSPEATIIATIDLPGTLFSSGIWADKLKGYMGVRGSFELRLQINAQPFQAGRMLMCYVPQGDMDFTQSAYRASSLLRASQLPGVQLEVLHDTEAVLTIPYVAPTTHYVLYGSANERFSWGRVYVIVYSSLRSGVASSAGYTVWGSLKDVELINPTFEFQSRKKAVKVGEAQKLAEDTTGSSLQGTTGIVKMLDGVPLLSSYLKPAMWAADLAAGAASAFGFSKPRLADAEVAVNQRPGRFLMSSDGPDSAVAVGTTARNELELLENFAGTDIDETSIVHIAGTPAYWNHYLWGTSQTTNTVLFTYPLNPTYFKEYFTSGNTLISPTPIAFLGSLFSLWRGSIKITLKIMRTKFHSGRLALIFGPYEGLGSSAVTVPSNLAHNPFAYREIIDLQDEHNEWEFELPYSSTRQYLRARALTDFRNPSLAGSNLEYYGTVSLVVLNPLKRNSSVADSVDIVVEVSMGKDAEFAVPATFTGQPIVNVEEEVEAIEPPPEFQFQGRGVQDVGAIATASNHVANTDASRYCIGEKITSLRQLGHRYSFLRPQTAVASLYQEVFWTPHIGGTFAVNTATPTLTANGGFLQDWLRSCYRYSRGTVNVCLVSDGVPFRAKARLYIPATNTGPRYPANWAITVGAYEGYLEQSQILGAYQTYENNIFEFAVPFYNQYPIQINWYGSKTNDVPWSGMPLTWLSLAYRSRDTNTLATPDLGYAFGDDFQLGCFIGVLPITVATIIT